ncbi:hypothetical protein RCL_jg3592.t1 [Rhizophagus clarus]|uniref:Uncharacterized protein n=1 Tax=Rhizophagus clarus TaxID=94130 RepID=A0A8H3M2S8_9GLOM|nr:hypothetical protein RCL_jg3592.t1 [Rhizophagus clarus]
MLKKEYDISGLQVNLFHIFLRKRARDTRESYEKAVSKSSTGMQYRKAVLKSSTKNSTKKQYRKAVSESSIRLKQLNLNFITPGPDFFSRNKPY